MRVSPQGPISCFFVLKESSCSLRILQTMHTPRAMGDNDFEEYSNGTDGWSKLMVTKVARRQYRNQPSQSSLEFFVSCGCRQRSCV